MNWRHPNDTLWIAGDFSIELFDVSGQDRYEVYKQRTEPRPPVLGFQTVVAVKHDLIGFAPTLAEAKTIARMNAPEEALT